MFKPILCSSNVTPVYLDVKHFIPYQLPQSISSSTEYGDGVIDSIPHVIKRHVTCLPFKTNLQ